MRVFVIVDASKRKAKPAGVLIWEPDENHEQGRFSLKLSSVHDEGSLPLSLSAYARRADRCATPEESEAWVRSRIVPEDRHNISEVLRANGLTSYDEAGLLAACQGRSSDDDLLAYEVAVPDGFEGVRGAQASRADRILASVERRQSSSGVRYALISLADDGEDGATARSTQPSPAQLAGQLVRARRRALGLTQTQLAARAGITQTVLSRVESGAGNPTLALLDDIAAALGAQLHIDIS